MKLRFRSAPPRLARARLARPSSADGTLLPAVLTGVLALTLAVQFALPETIDLPPAGPIGAGALMPRLADPRPRGVPAAVLARPIFAPSGATADGEEGVAAADPLGGAVIAGFIGVGRARVALVTEGKTVRRVGVGGTIAGWRLVGLTPEAALLRRGGERLVRPYPTGGAGSAAGGENAGQDDYSEENP